MKRHTFEIWALFFITLFAFVISVMMNSMFTALISLLAGFVLAFVMGIAWVRFEGYPPEHHPPIDKVVDDTDP